MFITASMLSAGPAASDDFWYAPVGTVSASGARVSPDSAMRLSVVFACVRVLSESVAKIPMRLMRGINERVTDHPLSLLVARRPNRWQTAFEFREMLQAHLSLRSNAYAQIVYGAGGVVRELVPLHPDRVTVEQIGDLAVRYVVTDWQGRQRVLVMGEVLHIRQLPMDGFSGLSTAAMQREPLGSALSAQDFFGPVLPATAPGTAGCGSRCRASSRTMPPGRSSARPGRLRCRARTPTRPRSWIGG